MAQASNENLNRQIGVRSLALAILNVTVGSGIFVIPAIIAGELGAAAISAYLVCGLLIFLVALCFAKAGSKTTCSGGPYTYIAEAFGPFAGFLANNIYWIGGCVFSDAAIASALADTLRYFLPFLSNPVYRSLFLLLVFALLAGINLRSVKDGVRFIEITSLAKIVPLAILVLLAAGFVHTGNLQWTHTPGIRSVGAASLLLFFAFLGLEGPLSNGGEIRNPERTVPLGLLLGIGAVLVLYISIQLVTQGVLGNTIAAHKDAPLAAVAGIVLGSWGPVLLIAITAIAMLGTLAGDILSIPRILFAGARDGLLPKPLAKVHSRFRTPYLAIITYAGAGFVLAVSGGFKQLATIASAAVLLTYLGVVLASAMPAKNNISGQAKTFRLPASKLIALLASAGIVWLLCSLTKPELAGIGIFIAAFSAVYGVMLLLRKRPEGKK